MLTIFKKKESKIYAPVQGRCIPIEEVPDPVFAKKLMGEGIGLSYEDDTLYSPCNGKILLIAKTRHAIGIQTSNGAELLIHIGLDTVQLNGEGFSLLVNIGDKVKAGQPLIKIDRTFMKEQGINLITPMVITNVKNYDICIEKKKNLMLGDLLITLRKKE